MTETEGYHSYPLGVVSGTAVDLVGWTQVNPSQLSLHQMVWKTDKNIPKGFRTLCNALLSGSILFQSKSEMKTSRFEQSDEAAKWRSKVYSELSKDAIADYYKNGFVLISSASHDREDEFGRRPVVLDTSYLDIFFRANVRKEIVWRIFERMEASFTTTGTVTDNLEWGLPSNTEMISGGGHAKYQTLTPRLERREIFDFKVYVMNTPTADGYLTSDMVPLIRGMWVESFILQKSCEAQTLRSKPPMVSQKETPKADDSALVLGNPQTDRNPGGDSGSAMSHSLYMGNGTGEGPLRGSQAMRLMAGASSAFDPCNPTQTQTRGKTATRTVWVNGEPVTEVYLENDRSLVKTDLPEPAWDAYFQYGQARLEDVMMMFGIPAPMVSQKDSLGGKTSMNENAQEIYIDTKNQIRQMLLEIMMDVYREFSIDSHAADYLIATYSDSETPSDSEGDPGEETQRAAKRMKRGIDTKGFRDAVDVTITMPGMPPQELTMELFDRKMLKYEALVKYLCARWSYPMDNFETAAPPNEIMEKIREKEAGKIGGSKGK